MLSILFQSNFSSLSSTSRKSNSASYTVSQILRRQKYFYYIIWRILESQLQKYTYFGGLKCFFLFLFDCDCLRHKEGIWCISVSANARNSINTKMAVNNYIMPQSFRAAALALSCSLSLSLHVLRDATYKWPQRNIIVYSHFCINAIARVGTYWNASDSILMHTSNKSLNTPILRLD